MTQNGTVNVNYKKRYNTAKYIAPHTPTKDPIPERK